LLEPQPQQKAKISTTKPIRKQEENQNENHTRIPIDESGAGHTHLASASLTQSNTAGLNHKARSVISEVLPHDDNQPTFVYLKLLQIDVRYVCRSFEISYYFLNDALVFSILIFRIDCQLVISYYLKSSIFRGYLHIKPSSF